MAAAVNDSTTSQQNENSEQQQINYQQQNLNRNVTDAAIQAADPNTWTMAPQELTTQEVGTDGKAGFYADQSLPSALNSDSTGQSANPMHQYMNDLQTVLGNSSALLGDLNQLETANSGSTAGDQGQYQSALNSIAQAVMNFDSQVLGQPQQMFGGQSGEGSGWGGQWGGGGEGVSNASSDATSSGTGVATTQTGEAPSTWASTANGSPTFSDPITSQLEQTDPNIAQTLTDSQLTMTAAGYNQYEGLVAQNVQSGVFPDDESLMQASAYELHQQGGSQADLQAAETAITNDLGPNGTPGDAAVSTFQGGTVSGASSSGSGSEAGASAIGSDGSSRTPTSTSGSGSGSEAGASATGSDGSSGTSTSSASGLGNGEIPSGTGSSGSDGTPSSSGSGAGGDSSSTASDGTGSSTTATIGTGTNTTTSADGNYSVINGQIIGPDGKPFDAKGVAVYASQAQSEAATIMQQMPDLNFIRLASTPSTDSPAEIQADIQAFQSINPNVVVEVEDHTSPGTDGTTSNVDTGQDLTNEENWYSQIAAANTGNANVWFGTANEPNDPNDQQAVVDQESGIYNAIRSTGNNNMIMLEAQGGGFFAPQQADPSAYADMQNVAWDIHYYGWETNGDNSVSDNVSAIQNEINGASGITESDGAGGQQAIPFIIGEYGDSSGGQVIDSNAQGAVDAVQTANDSGLVQGAVGWTWNGNNEPNNADAMTQDGTTNTVTPYGQEVIGYVDNDQIGAVT